MEHESDAEYDQLVAVACLTVPGERIQVPTFGVADPAFVGFAAANLARHVLDFGPPVSVEAARVSPRSDGREEMTVTWTRLEETT